MSACRPAGPPGARRPMAIAAGVLAVAIALSVLPAGFVPGAGEPVQAASRTARDRGTFVQAKPRLRSERPRRQAQRRGYTRLECKAWKYHGADQIPRPYDPDRFVYTEEYKRDPGRPGREEAARLADAAFPTLIDVKVLRMLHLINRIRERRGHSTMKLEPRLMVAAKRHNLDIARHALMQHTGTDCSQLGDRVWDEGYTWRRIAENLAGGRATAEATMQQWTGSARHLMQMTLTGMTEAGIAYDYNPNPPRHGIPIKHFWTLIMARPDPWRDRLWPKKPAPCTGKDCPKPGAEPANPADPVGKTGRPESGSGDETRTQ